MYDGTDSAPAPIDVLYELRQKRPDLFEKMEVYVDGGVRRGTDVLKALCLGAKGVGLGRPFLYANGAYGEEGVVKVVRSKWGFRYFHYAENADMRNGGEFWKRRSRLE